MPTIHRHEVRANGNVQEAMVQCLYIQLKWLVCYLNSPAYDYQVIA